MNSVNQGHGHGTKGRANLYNWIVLRRRYQAEEQKKVEERTRLYTQRQALSEPLTRLPCPCNAVISVFRYGTVTSPPPSKKLALKLCPYVLCLPPVQLSLCCRRRQQ